MSETVLHRLTEWALHSLAIVGRLFLKEMTGRDDDDVSPSAAMWRGSRACAQRADT